MKDGALFRREAKGSGVSAHASPSHDSTYASKVSAEQLKKCSSKDARELLPYQLAERFQALPLGVVRFGAGELVLIAVEDSSDAALLRDLQFATGRRVRLATVNKSALAEAIFLAYHDDEESLVSVVSELRKSHRAVDTNYSEAPRFRGICGDAASLLERLIDYAIAKGASDIHLIPRHDGAYIKLRINGELYSHSGAIGSLQLHQQVISRIKILSSLDTTCRNLPQDGAFQVPIGSRQVHLRVSTLPTVHGEKAVLRIAGSERLRTLDALEICEEVLAQIEEIMRLPEGAVLLSGPTGSGKTTTMYALIAELSRRNLNVVSVEDPVEVHIDGISQTQICPSQGLDYAAGLRSILRQDPNVIMLGEMRDSESAKVAMQAALSGHLIVSTVHARSASEVFLRLSRLGVDSLTMAHALKLAISQRLFPRLCDDCKIFDLGPSRELEMQAYRQAGCSKCDYSGYSGRVMAVDSIYVDGNVATAIKSEELTPKALSQFYSEGAAIPFHKTVSRLLAEGKISYCHARPFLKSYAT